jgi:tripartite-type tricarboxylate transporter receptor subunit TctC
MTLTQASRRGALKKIAAGGLAAAVGLPAWSQADKPINFVVGFTAGGGADIVARLLAQHMSQSLGRPVVVNNLVGASGNIATQHVCNAKPDGSTYLISSMTQVVVSPHTFDRLPFDPIDGLTHICMTAQTDFVVSVNSNVPVKTAGELVAYTKQHPHAVNFGTAGPGTVIHVMAELFKQRSGADILSVHYKGSAQMITDIVGNVVQGCVDGIQTVEQYAKQGKIKMLCVASNRRNPLIPDVPTAAEAGIKDFGTTSNWFGLHGPAGIPVAMQNQIYEAAHAAANRPDVKERLKVMGLEPMTQLRAEFPGLIKQQAKLFGEVARRGNIRAA